MRNHLRDVLSGSDFVQRERNLRTAIEEKMSAMPVKLEDEALNRLLTEQVGAF